MNSGGCSTARMISAAPPAVGSAAISAPMNGPSARPPPRRPPRCPPSSRFSAAGRRSSSSAGDIPVILHAPAGARRKAADCSRAKPPAPASTPRASRAASAARLSTMTASAKPPSPITAFAITAAVAGPPTRWCRMIMMLVSTIGNTARLPLAVGADAEAERDHRSDQQARPCRRAARGRTSASARAASARGAAARTAR